MTGNKKVTDIITMLSQKGRVFYYGSTAVLKYKNQKIKIYKILTDLNIAEISLITGDLNFIKSMDFDCHLVVDDDIWITFITSESQCVKNIEFLKELNVRYDNILFDFFYSVNDDRYYIFNDEYLQLLKHHKVPDDCLLNLTFEELIDFFIILTELNIKYNDTFFDNIDESLKSGKITFETIKKQMPVVELLFTGKHPYKALMFLDRSGILGQIFPFLKTMKGINQDRYLHPEGDVYEHTINCFEHIKNPSIRLFYGLLLHDFGKSLTKPSKGFHGHCFEGAKKVKELLQPYGYGYELIKDVQFLVEYHMVKSYYNNMTDYEKEKYFNNELGVDLLKLFKADLMGSIGKIESYVNVISDLKRTQKKSFRNKLFEEIKHLNFNFYT